MRRCWWTRGGACASGEIAFTGPDTGSRPTRLTFAVGSLARGAGGIAELSRQALAALRELADEGRIGFRLQVLDDDGPAKGDPLFENASETTGWHGGRRHRFAATLLREPSELVLFDHVGLARAHGVLAPLRRRPYALMIHSVEIWRSERTDYARTAHRASLLIANSNYTARQARNRHPDLPEIAVCWPGKDPEPSWSGAIAETQGEFGPRCLLIVGRLDASQRHKGHDQLLSAMPHLLTRVPEARLVIAGDGSDRQRLEAKAASLGVGSATRFLGRVSDVELAGLYRDCGLFVMLSDGDGFGMVFLEAMAHGLPCVGLAGSAAEEILDGGSCGALVGRDDAAGLAEALSGLLRDSPRRAALGAAGMRRYHETFTRSAYAERFKELLGARLLQAG